LPPAGGLSDTSLLSNRRHPYTSVRFRQVLAAAVLRIADPQKTKVDDLVVGAGAVAYIESMVSWGGRGEGWGQGHCGSSAKCLSAPRTVGHSVRRLLLPFALASGLLTHGARPPTTHLLHPTLQIQFLLAPESDAVPADSG
jgi:hypothetical protein